VSDRFANGHSHRKEQPVSTRRVRGNLPAGPVTTLTLTLRVGYMMLRRFLNKIEPADRSNARIGGLLIAAIMVLVQGAMLLSMQILDLDDPSDIAFFGPALLLTGLLFGAFGWAITLFFSVLFRQWPQAMTRLSQEYETFAEQVDGTVVSRQPPGLFSFLGPMPRQVTFQHEGHDVVLEIITKGDGEYETTYTCLTFRFSAAQGFTCRVYPSGLLAHVGEFFGLHDVKLDAAEFDDHFVVKASDQTRAREVLNEEVQTCVMRLATWAETVRDRSVLGSQYIKCIIDKATLRFELTGLLMLSTQLITYVEHGKRLFDALERR